MANISESLYVDLKREIISGQYAPGTRMREEHIANEKNVSRTPVRSALTRLVDDGLLKMEGKSITVAEWQRWDIDEIFELRLLLEPHGAGLAAERATDGEIEAMHFLNEKMQDAIDGQMEQEIRIKLIQDINNDFHHAVLNASRSGRLQEMLDTYLDVPIIVGSFYFYSEQDVRSSLDHHRQILSGIRQRNRSYAQEAMRFHILASKMRYSDKVSQERPAAVSALHS